jgi:parallel beta-helix repeat protein
MRSPVRWAVSIMAAVGVLGAITACSPGAPEGSATSAPADTQDVVTVTNDAELADAGSRVAAGGIIMIEPGTYHSSLEVRADDVTVRGTDRNGVILDGEFTRSNGVVMTGARVSVENLTVRNFVQNGVLITGVTDENGAGVARGPDGYLPGNVADPVAGYLVQSVTAQNNGLYGIYAFNRTGGVIRSNLASGGSDSGIYVGQCEDCNAEVSGNVVTLNAVGIELANASNVVITGNRIAGNRIGLTILSNYLEAHGPTRGVRIAGNVITDNDESQTPEQATGAFGVGVGLSGTVDAVVRANLITGNPNAGVWVNSSDDFAPSGTSVTDNVWDDSALAVVFAPSAEHAGSQNCFQLPAGARTEPPALATAACSDGIAPAAWAQPVAPAGISFAKVATTPERPGLDSVDETPRTLPDAVDLPDVSTVSVPAADLLADPAA